MIGKAIAHYQIEALLDAGGMGETEKLLNVWPKGKHETCRPHVLAKPFPAMLTHSPNIFGRRTF